MDDETEQWRSVVGYEGLYSVSNNGMVRRDSGRTAGRILKGQITEDGYIKVLLSRGRKDRKSRNVHTLVATAFIGERPVGAEINHQDGIKTNNHVSNLEWVSRAANIQHAYRMGLMTPRQGEAHGRHKLTDDDVRKIRILLGYTPAHILSEAFNVSTSVLYDIRNCVTWRHLPDY